MDRETFEEMNQYINTDILTIDECEFLYSRGVLTTMKKGKVTLELQEN